MVPEQVALVFCGIPSNFANGSFEEQSGYQKHVFPAVGWLGLSMSASPLRMRVPNCKKLLENYLRCAIMSIIYIHHQIMFVFPSWRNLQVNRNNAMTLTWSQFKNIQEAQKPQSCGSLGDVFLQIGQLKPNHWYLGGRLQNWWQGGAAPCRWPNEHLISTLFWGKRQVWFWSCLKPQL